MAHTSEEKRAWFREYNKTESRQQYMKSWKKNRKANVSIHQDKYSWKKKERMLEAVADGHPIRCVKCGNKDKRVLQIHHINGDGNRDPKFYRDSIPTVKVSSSKKEWPITELEIRCANCNILAEYEELGRRYVSAESFNEDGTPVWMITPTVKPVIKEQECYTCHKTYKPRCNKPRKHFFCSVRCYHEWLRTKAF